jgi:hypothetical protein
MKQQVIETAGKAWRTLGEKGEVSIIQLPRLLKENEAVTYQALGWLAREDKINYTTRNNVSFVSLVESELKIFKNILQSAKNRIQSGLPLNRKKAI